MVHFFGILHPGSLERRPTAEAPAKASFFGGAVGDEALTRLEWEAGYLSGKAPEPDIDRDRNEKTLGRERQEP